MQADGHSSGFRREWYAEWYAIRLTHKCPAPNVKFGDRSEIR